MSQEHGIDPCGISNGLDDSRKDILEAYYNQSTSRKYVPKAYR